MKKDEIWKRIINKLFKEFVNFFMPDLYNDIDFNYGYTFLDKEFSKITAKSKTKNREVDKLVEVKLKNGEDRLILIHIEVQDSQDTDFAFRMYQYQYRIFDKFNKDVVAMAIFTDKSKTYKPDSFKKSLYGTEIIYKFNTYKVLDQNEEELKSSNNPFALIILTSLYQIKAKKDDNKKYNFKIQLIKILLDKGYNKQDIRDLFEFIDILINIDDLALKETFYSEVDKMAKTKQKILMGDYMEIAMKKAVEQALEKAKKEEDLKIAKKMKQEGLAIDLISKITELSKKEIDNL